MSLTSTDIEKFLVVLKQSGLIDESAIEAASSDYLKELEDDDSPSAEDFASLLVEQKFITSWHASKILKGKHKGFFLGKYKLLRLLGKGGMSSVYLAEHINMKRHCAIKVLPYKLVSDSSYLSRFYREAQAVAALDHPNIVRAYDVDHQTDGEMEIHFLVMEYVTGMNFYELVKTHGPLAPTQAAEYIRQGALGLEHAHQAGMVHRDIKPGNFLIDNSGTVKLMDLGLAMVMQDKDFSVTLENEEKVLGTADYLAPEQAVDSHLIDNRADIYALGCTFYFMLTGRPPFDEGTLAQRLLAHQTMQPPDISDLRKEIPREIARIIHQMMEKDPDSRIQSAAVVAKRLEEWLEHPEAKESSDSIPEIIINTDENDSEIEKPNGAISDFLSHLEEKSGKTSESPPQSGQVPQDKTNKNQKQESGDVLNINTSTDSEVSVFHSGKSSIVSTSSRQVQSTRKNVKKKSRMKPMNIGLLSIAVLTSFIVIYFLDFTSDSSKKDNSKSLPAPPPVASSNAKTLKNETFISIGPQGDFQNISEAIAYLLDPLNSEVAAEIHEIKITSDQTLEESVNIVSTGFESLPQPMHIHGEGPKIPVLKSNSGPVIVLDSVEQLTISDLQIDCTNQPAGIEIAGYLTGTSLQNINFKNVRDVGILAKGASGLVGNPMTISNCRFEASTDLATGIRCESSETSNIRLLNIQKCQFIGPMAKGIVFASPQGSTWDVNLSESIFYRARTGITFSGNEHDVSQIKIVNNTFYEFHRGIQFEAGPVPSSAGVTFLQNLFVAGNGFEVSTESQNVSLQNLSMGAVPPQANWTTAPEQDSPHWLNIFAENGKIAAEGVTFQSTDPESPVFLKPKSAIGSSTGIDGRNFIGAVAH